MSNTCLHPFKHAGAGRTDRLLKALMPSNVAIDNRDMSDLMVFAARFGTTIRYWDKDNAPDGDWSCFWESDYLFFLATVAASNTEGVEKKFREAEKKLLADKEAQPTTDTKEEAKKKLQENTLALIEIIRQLALDITSWGQKADNYPALQQDVATIVGNTLQQPLRDLIAYAKGLPFPTDFDAFIHTKNRHPFAKEWAISQFDYAQNIDFIDPTIDVFASWQALKRIYRRFLLAHQKVRKQAQKYLELSQNDPNRRQHPPHIVLFLSFLHLFRHLQDQLNALPEKHLDYYYNDILHLQNRREIPDHAHLVFQLARNVYQHTLPANTAFKAGKTPDGKDMFYHLERPLTLNQAQVVEVKTLLVQPNSTNSATVTAAKQAWQNTVLDADKTNDVPDKMKDVLPFRPLGNAATDKKVEVGFAISSPIIPKTKSKRTLTFNFIAPNIGTYTQKLNDNFKLEVTAKEDWQIKKEPLLHMALSISGLTKEGLPILTAIDELTKLPIKDFDRLGELVNPVDKFKLKLTKTNIDGQYTFEKVLIKDTPIDFALKGYNPFSTKFTGLGDFTRLNLPTLGRDINDTTATTVGASETDVTLAANAKPENTYTQTLVALKNEPVFSNASAFKKDKSFSLLTEPVVKFSLTDKSFEYAEVYDVLSTTALTAPINATIKVEDLTDFDIYEGSVNHPLGHTQNIDLTNAYRQGGLIVRCDEAFKKGLQSLTFTFERKGTDATIDSAELFINGSYRSKTLIKSPTISVATGATPVVVAVKTTLTQQIDIQDIQKLLVEDESNQAHLEAFLKINLTYLRPFKKDSTTEREAFDSPVFADVSIGYSIVKDLDDTEFFHISSHSGYAATKPEGSPLMPPFPNPEPMFPTVVATKEAIFIAANTEGGAANPETTEQPRGVKTPADTPPPPIFYRGNLFIGVKDIPKLGILSLLFQVADGTELDFEAFPPDIEWSYLSDNQWKRFPSSSLIFDSTKADETSKRSLVQSGIIEFQMPKDVKKGNTLLNPAYYWLRASATETKGDPSVSPPILPTSVNALPSIVGIFAQAGRVVLATSPIDNSHFDAALPPSTINQLKFRQAAVRLIEQNYEGFGGRAVEQGAAYHLRISERLRHRKRAITAWDYEHLALEQFPELRFVKCINHSFPTSKTEFNTLKTGAVAVVVMPLKTTTPMTPHVNRSALENIKSFLKKYSNGFTSGDDTLQVIPPQYQPVVVSLSVHFHAGDIEQLTHNLDKDIARFIAPWAFDLQIEPSFGQNIYRTTLLRQIEALDYVDFIENFVVANMDPDFLKENRAPDGQITRKVVVTNGKLTTIAPNDARTLLTSYALTGQTPFETNHSITPIL